MHFFIIQVDDEKNEPHSQTRVLGGKLPHIWSQSLYIVGCLLSEVINVLNICVILWKEERVRDKLIFSRSGSTVGCRGCTV
jgi:hypothetical protein